MTEKYPCPLDMQRKELPEYYERAKTPEWLSVHQSTDELPLQRYPRTKEDKEYERHVFESLFENAVDFIMEGRSIKHMINSDPRGMTYGRFMVMLKRDKERLERYWEAKEIGAEALIEDMKAISDDDAEDVQRSTLRINVRKFEVQTSNPQRYGDAKRLDVKTKDVTGPRVDTRALKNLSEEELNALENILSKVDPDATE